MDEAIPRLRAAGTDLADVEVKKAVGGLPKSLPETISAFANGGGGLIILGLDDSSRCR
ncbi:MAG: putative DNA binding domain-containing protein [Propionibacteriaceae bacterium]|nr:putative DNA binding domain-containing protein [Propionibacteriaceae bacterium]